MQILLAIRNNKRHLILINDKFRTIHHHRVEIFAKQLDLWRLLLESSKHDGFGHVADEEHVFGGTYVLHIYVGVKERYTDQAVTVVEGVDDNLNQNCVSDEESDKKPGIGLL
jgi:hypothetical protein